MKSILSAIFCLSAILGFLLMGNDLPTTTPGLMDFDGFPEYNLYGALVMGVSILLLVVVNKWRVGGKGL